MSAFRIRWVTRPGKHGYPIFLALNAHGAVLEIRWYGRYYRARVSAYLTSHYLTDLHPEAMRRFKREFAQACRNYVPTEGSVSCSHCNGAGRIMPAKNRRRTLP